MSYQPLVAEHDTPITVDLSNAEVAQTWAREAELKRPWRSDMRKTVAHKLNTALTGPLKIVELGCGPGFLAEEVLVTCDCQRYVASDYSEPMLEMCRERLARMPAAELCRVDFKREELLTRFGSGFDAVVAMQAIHEIRHKCHFALLYAQVRSVLRTGGLFLVCDHEPMNDLPLSRALYATPTEQNEALLAAGFGNVRLECNLQGLYLFSAQRS